MVKLKKVQVSEKAHISVRARYEKLLDAINDVAQYIPEPEYTQLMEVRTYVKEHSEKIAHWHEVYKTNHVQYLTQEELLALEQVKVTTCPYCRSTIEVPKNEPLPQICPECKSLI